MAEYKVDLRASEAEKLRALARHNRRKPKDEAAVILAAALTAIDVKAKATAPAPSTGVSRPDA